MKQEDLTQTMPAQAGSGARGGKKEERKGKKKFLLGSVE